MQLLVKASVPEANLRYNARVQTGGDLDSTTVTKLSVHVVMVANHVNQKLQTISCQ